MAHSTVTDLRPSEAHDVVAHLNDRPMRLRAAASLDVILKVLGRGAKDDLASALNVSGSTIKNWSPRGKFPPSADQVRDICRVYTHTEAEAAELFDLMYSDNRHDALTWLIAQGSERFAWNIVDHAGLVA